MKPGMKPGSQRDRAVVGQRYTVYGGRHSFFTQKLTCAMNWYFGNQTDFLPPRANPDAAKRAGTHQIPVLLTPENWCIADSTPILHLLDARMTQARFYPAGFTGAVVMLMEEYFDEWWGRQAIHSRWTDDANAEFAAAGIANDVLGPTAPQPLREQFGAQIKGWGRRALRALGMSSQTQQDAADAELVRVYRSLAEHLVSHGPFVLGSAPSAVDAVLMGGLRAHFLHDPYPTQLLATRLPTPLLAALREYMQRWDETVAASATHTPLPLAGVSELPLFVRLVLTEMSGFFRNFVLENERALLAGKRAFKIPVYGEEVSYLCRPYVQKSREMLRRALHTHLFAGTSTAADRAAFDALLGTLNLEHYAPLVRAHL